MNPVEEIKGITSGGVNYAAETAGRPGILRQAVDSLTFCGTVVQIGGGAARDRRENRYQ